MATKPLFTADVCCTGFNLYPSGQQYGLHSGCGWTGSISATRCPSCGGDVEEIWAQCPSCGFAGTIDDFDALGADEDKVFCPRCAKEF